MKNSKEALKSLVFGYDKGISNNIFLCNMIFSLNTVEELHYLNTIIFSVWSSKGKITVV